MQILIRHMSLITLKRLNFDICVLVHMHLLWSCWRRPRSGLDALNNVNDGMPVDSRNAYLFWPVQMAPRLMTGAHHNSPSGNSLQITPSAVTAH